MFGGPPNGIYTLVFDLSGLTNTLKKVKQFRATIPVTKSKDTILSNKKNNFTNNVNAALPLVIVNPKSAGGSTQNRWAETASDFRAHFGAFQVAFTKKAG